MVKCVSCIYCSQSVYSLKEYCALAYVTIQATQHGLNCKKHATTATIKIPA